MIDAHGTHTETHLRHHPKYLCPNMPSKISDQDLSQPIRKPISHCIILEKLSSCPNSCFCGCIFSHQKEKNIRLSHKFSASTLENSSSFSPVFVQGSSYCVRAVEALKHPQEGLDPPLGHLPPPVGVGWVFFGFGDAVN